MHGHLPPTAPPSCQRIPPPAHRARRRRTARRHAAYLKYYEERGLVSPTRSEGRYRLYDEDDLERFARILRLRSLGFSLHGITEMLKRPLEPDESGSNRYSTDSLQEIRDALAQQIDALDTRVEAMRRELKEAQTLKGELRP